MVVSHSRRIPSNGTMTVVASNVTTPFIEAWPFDQGSGWGTKYSAPGTPPGGADGRAVRFAPPDNSKILYSGKTTNLIYSFPFTLASGFGTATSQAYTLPVEYHFKQSEDRLLVSGSGVLAEYSYSGGTIGSLNWRIDFSPGIVRPSKYLDNDKYIIVGFTTSETWRIYVRNGDIKPTAFTTLSPHSSWGTPIQFSLSPVANNDGSKTLVASLEESGGELIFSHVTDGAISGTAFFGGGSTAHAGVWDAYGRLITFSTATPKLKIWTQDHSTKAFTQHDTTTDLDAHTAVSWMEYDHDQDIVFVGSNATPFIDAIRVNESGFGTKYTSLAGGNIPVDDVVKISLAYDEKWKHVNS